MLKRSFTPNDSVLLRISPNTKLENLDYDLLGGEDSYSITNNIEHNISKESETNNYESKYKSNVGRRVQKLVEAYRGRQTI